MCHGELADDQLLLNWRAYLRSGVTSVVSVGDDPKKVCSARTAEYDGTLVGPRIYAAGSVFTAPGGHPVGTILRDDTAAGVGHLAIEVGDPIEGRRRRRRLVNDFDVDLIKVIYSSIPGDGPRMRRDVLEARITEARKLDRPVFAHVSTAEETAACVAAGVNGLEHMVLDDGEVLDEVFEVARERGVYWTPTLSLFDRMAQTPIPPTPTTTAQTASSAEPSCPASGGGPRTPTAMRPPLQPETPASSLPRRRPARRNGLTPRPRTLGRTQTTG